MCPKNVLAAFDNGNFIIALMQETWDTNRAHGSHSTPLMGHGDSQASCPGCKQWRALGVAGRGNHLSESGTLELKQVKIK